ncbi:hypothetical protein BHE90_017687 [Fusarium euwallaceae]|uniref:SCA7 domain-containing protein n=1 Tax=Fusarium euwallaceae TaxID=1147111 RepID=A0A430KWT4_9HYPO|nr:hypothetical protein BHE90_017687 [Fusarium euwallaceae]
MRVILVSFVSERLDIDNRKAAGSKTGKEAAGNKSADDKERKKRKADGDPDKGPKTKKKDEPKAKVPKPSGKCPVEVDLQCGVMLTNSQPCARSLACKRHSMRAKRAVAGRTLPYDMLLDTYRKEKQAKQQEAALDVKAPVEDEG